MRIDIVYADDWAGVFVDDEIFYQDHSIRDDKWVDLVETAYRRGRRLADYASALEFRWWEVDYGWMDEHRWFPGLFSEIPEQYLEEK